MFKLICVTARQLCAEPLEIRISKLLSNGIDRVILREKDLSQEEYADLAERVLKYNSFDRRISLHFYPDVCTKLNHKNVHISFQALKDNAQIRNSVDVLGVSVHSLSEAKTAEELGADYVIVGHIFNTECKKNLPPRGLGFLSEICGEVKIPVYAIGGINDGNISKIMQCGANGACLMSSLMECEEVADYMYKIKESLSFFE